MHCQLLNCKQALLLWLTVRLSSSDARSLQATMALWAAWTCNVHPVHFAARACSVRHWLWISEEYTLPLNHK